MSYLRSYSGPALRLGGGAAVYAGRVAAALPQVTVVQGWVGLGHAPITLRAALVAGCLLQGPAHAEDELPQPGRPPGHRQGPPGLPNALRAALLHGVHGGRSVARVARQRVHDEGGAQAEETTRKRCVSVCVREREREGGMHPRVGHDNFVLVVYGPTSYYFGDANKRYLRSRLIGLFICLIY